MTEQDFHIPIPVWETLLKSCGLRRSELERLRVGDIIQDDDRLLWLHIAESEVTPTRDVQILNGFEWAIVDILARKIPANPEDAVSFQKAVKGRSPDELLVLSVPNTLDVERGRREYAWWMYFSTIESMNVVHYPRTFHEVGEQVRQALGLPRFDETIRKCMRQAKRDFMREYKASV